LTGSCHCGATRYIVFLTLPLAPGDDSLPTPKDGAQRMYRCNCTICHKAGILHVRLPCAPDDFMLLSPLSLDHLGEYKPGEDLRFLFCKTCAVRCFTFMGEGEVREVDLAKLGVEHAVTNAESGTTTVWQPKKEGWMEGRKHGCYLSVNGYTIDQLQDGFDLREWTEDKCVQYLNILDDDKRSEEPTFKRPHVGGAY
jgi:hypothetical protein